MLHTYEQTISEKEKNIERMKGELKELSRMRDMIFELTAKNKDDNSSQQFFHFRIINKYGHDTHMNKNIHINRSI